MLRSSRSATSGTGRSSRWRQAGQRVAGTHGVEMGIPGIVRFLVVPVGGYRAEVPLLPGPAAPVVGQLVAGDADQPGRRDRWGVVTPHGVDRRQEGLGGQGL